jgi:hypothetical protein
MGILVGVCLHPSLHEYPGCIPDTVSLHCASGPTHHSEPILSCEAETGRARRRLVV